jgi:hypothetical protein
MLDRIHKLAQTGAALAVLVFFASATYVLLRAPNLLLHADGTLTRTEAVLSKTRATMANVDTATKVWASSAAGQAKSVDDLVTDAHGTLSQANNALYSLHQSADAMHEDLGALHKTIDAASDLTAALTVDARTANTTIAAAQPVLEAYARAGDDLDAFLKQEAVQRIVTNVAGMTESGNGILGDFRKVADKETADWLKPVPWWKVPIKRGGELIDIGAAVARHAP